MLFYFLAGMFLLIAFGIFIERSLINFQTLFCVAWTSIASAASLGLYDMIHYDDSMYMVVLLGCMGFTLGYVLKPIAKIQKWNPVQARVNNAYSINKFEISRKTFDIFYYVSLLFMIYFTVKVIILLFSGVPYYMIRTLFGRFETEGAILTNKVEIYVQVFILQAVIPVFILFVVLHILKLITLTKSQLIKLMVLISLYVFVSGSRITVMNAIIQIFALFFILKIRPGRAYLKKIGLIIITLLVCISAISEGRVKYDAKTYISKEQGWYQDFTLAMPMGYHYIKMAEVHNDCTYGAMFFFGPINLFYRVVGLVGVQKPDIYKLCDKYHEMIDEFIPIFDEGTVNNAYASTFFYYYLDGGYWGVFLLSLLFGWMIKSLLRRTIKFRDIRSFMLLALIIIAFVKSFARWEFVNSHYCLSFVYVYILTKINRNYANR